MLKYFIISSVFIFNVIISQSAHAWDEAKVDYKALSITQLESIEQGDLSSKDKKKLTKELKKKKKTAEKAAKKAAKAAKKKAAKEAKVKKAAAKKIAAAKKKRLKKYTRIYKETKITGSDFDAYMKVKGPQPGGGVMGFLNAMGSPNEVGDHWFMRSFAYPKSVNHQLYFSINYQSKSYRRYTNASFRGGVSGEFTRLHGKVLTCEVPAYTVGCIRNEDMTVTIPHDMLMNAFMHGKAIALQLKSKSSDRNTVSIPAHYIQGYVRKMGDTLNNIPKTIMDTGVSVIEKGAAE